MESGVVQPSILAHGTCSGIPAALRASAFFLRIDAAARSPCSARPGLHWNSRERPRMEPFQERADVADDVVEFENENAALQRYVRGFLPPSTEAQDVVQDEAPVVDETPAADDLAAAFPGLANRSAPSTVDVEDDEAAQQLATPSPDPAGAIRAEAERASDERDALVDVPEEYEDKPVNRGLRLKLRSSVKS